MATPVYGKQYIRFAETGYVADTDSVDQFTVVSISANTEPPTISKGIAAGAHFGVVQQDVLVVDPEKATTLQRLATVATSGLLLVACDGTVTAASVGQPLEVGSATGVATETSSGGAEVTVNGGIKPTVRQLVNIGDVQHVMVSFS
jgi:hypothetical protein